jgi:hypothetical protein
VIEVVFVKDTAKRSIGEHVSFDEVSAAKIVARGDAEYAGTPSVPFAEAGRSTGQQFAAWGVKPDTPGE